MMKLIIIIISMCYLYLFSGCGNSKSESVKNNDNTSDNNTAHIIENQNGNVLLDYKNQADRIILDNAYKAINELNSNASFNSTIIDSETGDQIGKKLTLELDADVVPDTVQLQYNSVLINCGSSPLMNINFRPWPDYSIPNGSWLTGDFNGDKKDDIIHLVREKNYIHIWFSDNGGAFKVVSFSPWESYTITNGRWTAADFNGDRMSDIIHFVSSDYVNTWFSIGDGAFIVKSFRPWKGYSVRAGTWITANLNNDDNADLIHYCCRDYAYTWVSNGDGTYNLGTIYL